jgi:photosystem II stability/assembly factor-like uncharacterized protein
MIHLTRCRMSICLLLYSTLSSIVAFPAAAADTTPDPAALLKNFTARCLGPASMGGRIVDIAVVEGKPATIFVASASGGLWKTTNNGGTWTPVFDQQDTISIGDVAVAPSDPNIVWVGTGEANARNSVSWGDGIYKSKDGGKSWTNMGLKDTHHIGRIVIHPKNPDIVYVAALGHFWGPNKERGLFKTTDGGKTWTCSKFLSEDCGFVDVVTDPENPETLLAAAYAVRRNAFSVGDPMAMQFSPLGGVYKTTDGGTSWTKITKGLPERPTGRIGLDSYRHDPKVIYAIIQTDKTANATVAGQAAKSGDDPATGGIFRSEDGGDSWKKVNDLCPRPFYFGQIRVDPSDDQRVYVCGIGLSVSSDGGKTFRGDGAPRTHPDYHAFWIDPRDSDHLILGCDGGLYFSYDRGTTWEHIDNLPLAQFYAVAADMRKPYWVYGGLQDNGTWGGPSATHNNGGIANYDWLRLFGGDGFYCQVDPADYNTIYLEMQYGGLSRVNLAKGGEVKSIRPQAREGGARYNWCSPMLLSPHNAHTIYYGGNRVYKSIDRGDHWQTISPDLTRGQTGTLTVLAESPITAGRLWAGSDDGKIHYSKDGGSTWLDLSQKVPDVPDARAISRIEPSHFDAETVYITIDRHRNDDYKPYIFKSTDGGEHWQPIAHNLPADGSVYVVREDRKNKNLLFVGTEFGLYISLNGGESWERLRGGLPTVAVFDCMVHPRDQDLVIATHGRGMYVVNIAPLQQLTPEILDAKAALFDPPPATAFTMRSLQNGPAPRRYMAANPTYGATITYYLKDRLDNRAKITILDALGNELQELAGKDEPGIHHATWDLRPRVGAAPAGGRRTNFSAVVPPGDYVVKLTGGGVTVMKKLHVESEESPSTAREVSQPEQP